MKAHLAIALVFVFGEVKGLEDNATDITPIKEVPVGQFIYPEVILYHFFSKKYPYRSFKVTVSTINNLEYSDFNTRRDTLFIVHGWRGDNDSSLNRKIRETILKISDVNVFVVDWSSMASRNYISARRSVVRVGQYVADFILKLKKLFGLQLNKVKFIGFSLGAHVSGIAGAALNGTVDRIVGLDPAGPFFSMRNINERLDKTDAKFVQVIHTNGGILGFGYPLGHADYFPNGGRAQPGCGFDMHGGCAHSRAYAYYAESLLSDKFVAQRCEKYRDYINGNCFEEDISIMGGFKCDKRARGIYYLTTNSKPPFARG